MAREVVQTGPTETFDEIFHWDQVLVQVGEAARRLPVSLDTRFRTRAGCCGGETEPPPPLLGMPLPPPVAGAAPYEGVLPLPTSIVPWGNCCCCT